MAFQNLEIDTGYTTQLMEDSVGADAMHWMRETDIATYEHQLGVGQLACNILRQENFPDYFRNHVTVAGALHDVGKFRTDVLALIRQPVKLDDSQRAFVRTTHSEEGGRMLSGMELDLASFVAHKHHQTLPEEYHEVPHATAYGVTHLIKLCDVMHALAFDRHRTYITAREGYRPSVADVGALLLREFSEQPPIILGRKIDVEQAVKTQMMIE